MAKKGPKKGNAKNRSRGGAKAKAKSRTVAKVLVKASKKGSGKGPRSQKAVAKVHVRTSKTDKASVYVLFKRLKALWFTGTVFEGSFNLPVWSLKRPYGSPYQTLRVAQRVV